MSLEAIIFDFNRVLVDDELLHAALFQKVLAEEGIYLSKDEYYANYLPQEGSRPFTGPYEMFSCG